MPPVINKGFGDVKSCSPMSAPMFESSPAPETRVTTMPAESVIKSEEMIAAKSVAEGRNCIFSRRFRQTHFAHQNAGRKSGCDIDGGNNDRCYRITFDKFHRAVHRAVQLRFLAEFDSLPPGFFLRDQAGTQIGINRHLFSGHRIERKSRRDFRHALCALADDDKLND